MKEKISVLVNLCKQGHYRALHNMNFKNLDTMSNTKRIMAAIFVAVIMVGSLYAAFRLEPQENQPQSDPSPQQEEPEVAPETKVAVAETVVATSSLVMLESEFAEYQAFKDWLFEKYPYYEPSGIVYKEKIGKFFEEKQAQAEDLYDDIQRQIPDTILWEREDGTTFMQAPTTIHIKEDLQKLHPIFPEYINAICNLRTEAWLGGSGSSVGVVLCEIYETEKYIQLLKTYQESLHEDDPIEASKYISIMPVEIGTRWIYEGKRIFYNPDSKKAEETTAQKIVEITGLEKEGENLKVFTRTSYVDEPFFEGGVDSFIISESGYAFDGTNLINFPLFGGQRLSPLNPERTDNLYAKYVLSVGMKNILGKQYRCYDITDDTLSSESLEVFCEGLGYIRDSYKHHGTPDESDYNLIRLERPESNE